MKGYWSRKRLLPTIIMSLVVALIAVFLFAFPSVVRQADNYNDQSVYKNTAIDFIAPEPSFEQVESLPNTNGISKIFPFFLTKSQLTVNGSSRTTTILMSDQFSNVDITMYNDIRLIKRASAECENPILVDWQFCKDTAASLGDKVTLSIGDKVFEYSIYAIYETNTIYDGGAVLVQISDEQKKDISEKSQSNGYSGMYVSSTDYNTCKTFLTNDYRPLGRLRDRSQFSDEEQYQTHYNAIMSSGYANEITDFRMRESNLNDNSSLIQLCLGAIIVAVIMIAYNVVMSKRGCECVYFTKHSIPKGHNVRPYYQASFWSELLLASLFLLGAMLLNVHLSGIYIPASAYSPNLIIIPASILFAELICLIMNNIKVKNYEKVAEEEKRKKEAEKRKKEQTSK